MALFFSFHNVIQLDGIRNTTSVTPAGAALALGDKVGILGNPSNKSPSPQASEGDDADDDEVDGDDDDEFGQMQPSPQDLRFDDDLELDAVRIRLNACPLILGFLCVFVLCAG